MRTIQSLLVAASLFLVAGLTGYAGEFPDKWTWDDDSKTRAEHSALEDTTLRQFRSHLSLPPGE